MLIGPHAVITARHCKNRRKLFIGPLALGADPKFIRDVSAEDAVGTENCPSGNDIVVLTFTGDIDATPLPVCDQLAPGPQALTLVGYGLTASDGSGPWGARTFGTSRLGGLACTGSNNVQCPCRTPRELALLAAPGIADSCKRDSGGPVLIERGTNTAILGIISRSIDGKEGCGRGGIYVRGDAWVALARAHGATTLDCR